MYTAILLSVMPLISCGGGSSSSVVTPPPLPPSPSGNIVITPASATVAYGHTQQFTAAVNGAANVAVNWSATLGSIDANGLYTAPALILSQNGTDTVFASAANVSTATANIKLQIPKPVITSIVPNGASANEFVTINGQNFFGMQQIYFPGPNGTTLSAAVINASLTQLTTTVPLGVVDGPVFVNSMVFAGVITTSNSINFHRLPNIRIRASQKDLSSGESTQFTYRVLGASSSQSPTWTTNLGNISPSGLYQAPTVSQENFATVTGCLPNTRSCDSTMLRITPLRIAPPAPVVSVGNNLQLDAVEGSPISATWSVLNGGGRAAGPP